MHSSLYAPGPYPGRVAVQVVLVLRDGHGPEGLARRLRVAAPREHAHTPAHERTPRHGHPEGGGTGGVREGAELGVLEEIRNKEVQTKKYKINKRKANQEWRLGPLASWRDVLRHVFGGPCGDSLCGVFRNGR